MPPARDLPWVAGDPVTFVGHPSPMSAMSRPPVPLWPLPLAVAATLVVATHLAWWLSVQAGHVPWCIPYLEGCTSISRAARHGLGNHLFRLMVLPCALLVGIHWWLAGRWLRARGGGGSTPRRSRQACGT